MKILRQITYIHKVEKGKTEDTHYNDLTALFKNSEENNNGAVVGQKWPITNNDGSTNTPAKTVWCWGRFGNTKLSWPETPNPSKPWWC